MPAVCGSLNCFLAFCIFTAALGMFNFGYNTAVINAPAAHIRSFMEEVEDRRNRTTGAPPLDLLFSVGVAIFAIGGMFGGFFGGFLAHTLGRKGGMVINCMVAGVGGFLLYLMKPVGAYELFFIGRLIVGLSCGLSTCLAPLYISEVAPLAIRGALGTVNQLSVAVGILISQLLGLNAVLGGAEAWHCLLGLTIAPVLLQALLLFFCPETPPYLLFKKDNEEDAVKALKRLRRSEDVSHEIDQIRAEEEATKVGTSTRVYQLFTNTQLRRATFVAIVMQCSQQLSGINGVFYYSTDLFERIGVRPERAKNCNIGIGCIMVVMTMVTIPLMDTLGRKLLHLIGLGGMVGSSVFITIGLVFRANILSVTSVLLFVFFFAIGPGPIPWLITAELFTEGPRTAALAVATFVNWFTNFVVGLSFPSLANVLGPAVFVPFMLLLILFFLFTLFMVPETKNRPTAEITDFFS